LKKQKQKNSQRKSFCKGKFEKSFGIIWEYILFIEMELFSKIKINYSAETWYLIFAHLLHVECKVSTRSF